MSEKKPTLLAKNDSPRIKGELFALQSNNKALYDLVTDLADWINKEFNKDTVITMVFRTQEEQDAIYKNMIRGSRSYNERPWKSPHQTWTAIDIRTYIYTKEEIKKITEYLNNKYNHTNYYNITATYHEVLNSKKQSLGKHFHIQYAKK